MVECNVFKTFFMPWVGINTWCRFEDLTTQPAHIFAGFLFEYCFKCPRRDLDEIDRWCALDGRIIRALATEIESKCVPISDTTKDMNVDGYR